MPNINGLELCEKVSKEKPDTQVIILTMYKEKSLLKKARLNGAKSYLLKDNLTNEIITAIKMVNSNQYYWSENLIDLQKVIDKDDTEKKQVETLLSLLSETELKTLKMVSNHLTSKEISDNLFVTTKSVENYRSRICKKIGLDSGHNSLLVWALSYKEIIDQY